MTVRPFLAIALMTRCGAQEHLPPKAVPPTADADPVQHPADGVSIHLGRGLQTSSDFSCVDISSTISFDRKFYASTTTSN